MLQNRLIKFTIITLILLVLNPIFPARSQTSGDQTHHTYPFSVGFELDTFINMEVDLKSVKSAMDIWIWKVGRKISFSGRTYFYDDLSMIIKDLRAEKLDMVTMSPLNFIRISEKLDSDIAYSYTKNNKKTHKYLLLTRSDSGFTKIDQTKGINIALNKRDAMSRIMLDVLLFRNNQTDAKNHFSDIREMNKFSKTVLAVFFGQVESCFTTDAVFQLMVELNPQVGKNIKIVAESPEIINGVSFFRKGYSSEARSAIQNEISNIHQTVHGRQILMLFKIDGITHIEEKDFDSLNKIIKDYDKYKQND